MLRVAVPGHWFHRVLSVSFCRVLRVTVPGHWCNNVTSLAVDPPPLRRLIARSHIYYLCVCVCV